MFVYQNKEGHICVTFTDNKPVETPEYVIAIDEEAKALYMVSGSIESMPEKDTVDEVVEDAPVVVTPKVEELDNVVENDVTVKDSVVSDVTGNAGAPSVEELDDVVENDAVNDEQLEDVVEE